MASLGAAEALEPPRTPLTPGTEESGGEGVVDPDKVQY